MLKNNLLQKFSAVSLAIALPLTTASAETIDPVNDFRLGITLQQSPNISEEITGPGSPTKRYNWADAKAFGFRFDAMYFQGMSRRGRPLPGFLWEVGLSYGITDITPGSYETGSGTYPNTRDDLKLRFKQYGLSLGAGWATVPHVTELGDMHWEALGIARGGLSQAETVSPGLRASRERGGSTFWEAGVQGGFVLCESNWTFGMHLGWLYGRALTNINLPDGYESQLSIIRNGAEVGLTVGSRF